MSEYKLEIKQVVDYPRCRIYRQFIQTLMKDENIRIGGTSGLYYYTALCCYANFRTSYKRIDGISYTVFPGEWLCKASELCEWFRCRTGRQAISILNMLQERHLITYSLLGRGNLIKYRINDWQKSNRVLDYNAPCQKETGFFFIPIATANELVSYGKCSEMDAVLDMWINTVYNDTQVEGSRVGPVVYFRNGTGNPMISCEMLGTRWGVSKATASRYIGKLKEQDYIVAVSFPGSYGTAIYIKRYLSTMFEISDIMIDKDEVAMALNIKVNIPPEEVLPFVSKANVSVSNYLVGVSESHIAVAVEKVGKMLAMQGFPCFSCPQIRYKLLPLSDCGDTIIVPKFISKETHIRMLLTMECKDTEIFRFEITLTKEDETK